MTTPMFTPDGRLKQVEYATQAAMQSPPIIFLPLLIPSVSSSVDRLEDEVSYELALVVGTLSNARPPLNHVNNDSQEPNKKSLSQVTRRGQHRLITLPISYPDSPFSMCASSEAILVGLNGLLPDSMDLLSSTRDYMIQNLFASYGIHKLHYSSPHSTSTSITTRIIDQNLPSQQPIRSIPVMASPSSTVYRLAQFIASKCQERAFGGGLRPFGSSMVLCGVDHYPKIPGTPTKRGTKSNHDRIQICVVNPSGKITSFTYRCQLGRKFHEPYIPNHASLTSVRNTTHADRTNMSASQENQRRQTSNQHNAWILGGTDDQVREQLKKHIRDYIGSREKLWQQGLYPKHGQGYFEPPSPSMEVNMTTTSASSRNWNPNQKLMIIRMGLEAVVSALAYQRLKTYPQFSLQDELSILSNIEPQDIDLVLVTSHGGVQRISKRHIHQLLDYIQRKQQNR